MVVQPWQPSLVYFLHEVLHGNGSWIPKLKYSLCLVQHIHDVFGNNVHLRFPSQMCKVMVTPVQLWHYQFSSWPVVKSTDAEWKKLIFTIKLSFLGFDFYEDHQACIWMKAVYRGDMWFECFAPIFYGKHAWMVFCLMNKGAQILCKTWMMRVQKWVFYTNNEGGNCGNISCYIVASEIFHVTYSGIWNISCYIVASERCKSNDHGKIKYNFHVHGENRSEEIQMVCCRFIILHFSLLISWGFASVDHLCHHSE